MSGYMGYTAGSTSGWMAAGAYDIFLPSSPDLNQPIFMWASGDSRGVHNLCTRRLRFRPSDMAYLAGQGFTVLGIDQRTSSGYRLSLAHTASVSNHHTSIKPDREFDDADAKAIAQLNDELWMTLGANKSTSIIHIHQGQNEAVRRLVLDRYPNGADMAIRSEGESYQIGLIAEDKGQSNTHSFVVLDAKGHELWRVSGSAQPWKRLTWMHVHSLGRRGWVIEGVKMMQRYIVWMDPSGKQIWRIGSEEGKDLWGALGTLQDEGILMGRYEVTKERYSIHLISYDKASRELMVVPKHKRPELVYTLHNARAVEGGWLVVGSSHIENQVETKPMIWFFDTQGVLQWDWSPFTRIDAAKLCDEAFTLAGYYSERQSN